MSWTFTARRLTTAQDEQGSKAALPTQSPGTVTVNRPTGSTHRHPRPPPQPSAQRPRPLANGLGEFALVAGIGTVAG